MTPPAMQENLPMESIFRMMVLGPPMYENAPMELISKRPSRSWIQGSEVMGESRRVWEGEGMDIEEEASCLAMCGRMGVSGAGVKVAACGVVLWAKERC